MTTISGASAFAPQQLPPLDPPQVPNQDMHRPDVLVNNGATDCFPDDMAERLETQQTARDAGGQAAGIIDCLPEPEGGWPTLEGEVRVDPGDLQLPGGGIQVDPGEFDLPDIGFDRPNGIIDCLPEPDGGWPTLGGEATVREEIYMDDQGQIGTRTVVDAGKGDDSVQVTRNADGSATVTVNGERTELTPEQARNMRVTGGDGDDTITVVDNRDATTRLVDSVLGSDVKVQGGDGADRFEGQVDGTALDNNPFEGDTVNGKFFP